MFFGIQSAVCFIVRGSNSNQQQNHSSKLVGFSPVHENACQTKVHSDVSLDFYIATFTC